MHIPYLRSQPHHAADDDDDDQTRYPYGRDRVRSTPPAGSRRPPSPSGPRTPPAIPPGMGLAAPATRRIDRRELYADLRGEALPPPRPPVPTPTRPRMREMMGWLPETMRALTGRMPSWGPLPVPYPARRVEAIDPDANWRRIAQQIERDTSAAAVAQQNWLHSVSTGRTYREVQVRGLAMRESVLSALWTVWGSPHQYPDPDVPWVELESDNPEHWVVSLWTYLRAATIVCGGGALTLKPTSTHALEFHPRQLDAQLAPPAMFREVSGEQRHDVFACLVVPPGNTPQPAQILLPTLSPDDELIPYVAMEWACLIAYFDLRRAELAPPGHIGGRLVLPSPRGDRRLTPLLHAYARKLLQLTEGFGPACGHGAGTYGCECSLYNGLQNARPLQHAHATGALEQRALRHQYEAEAAAARDALRGGNGTGGGGVSGGPVPTSGQTPPNITPLRPVAATLGDPRLHDRPSQPSQPSAVQSGWRVRDLVSDSALHEHIPSHIRKHGGVPSGPATWAQSQPGAGAGAEEGADGDEPGDDQWEDGNDDGR